MQILMCPPDTCFATGGCTGSRIIDKQPVVCGIDTRNADVGTTYALRYVVYNSAGMKATVQRVISVVSPCDSGQYLCGNTCSGVSQEGPFLACVPLLACAHQLRPGFSGVCPDSTLLACTHHLRHG